MFLPPLLFVEEEETKYHYAHVRMRGGKRIFAAAARGDRAIDVALVLRPIV